MPTYDYVCEACDHEFEAFQSITARQLRKCPVCGKLKLKRQFGPGGGLIFKGSGFYITDYRSSEYKSKAEAEKKAGSATKDSSGKDASSGSSAGQSTGKSTSTGSKRSGKSSSGSSGGGSSSSQSS